MEKQWIYEESDYLEQQANWNSEQATWDSEQATWNTYFANANPIVVDLDGDGVEIITLDKSNAYIDFDNDGFVENGAWAGSDDGLLVIDLDSSGNAGADGVIDQTKEFVFTQWDSSANTDLAALKNTFDSNDDGVLDAQDTRFSEFRIWQDVNSNGVSEAGELKTLASLVLILPVMAYKPHWMMAV